MLIQSYLTIADRTSLLPEALRVAQAVRTRLERSPTGTPPVSPGKPGVEVALSF